MRTCASETPTRGGFRTFPPRPNNFHRGQPECCYKSRNERYAIWGSQNQWFDCPWWCIHFWVVYFRVFFFYFFFYSNEVKCIDRLLKYKSIRYQPRGKRASHVLQTGRQVTNAAIKIKRLLSSTCVHISRSLQNKILLQKYC